MGVGVDFSEEGALLLQRKYERSVDLEAPVDQSSGRAESMRGRADDLLPPQTTPPGTLVR